MEHDTESKKTNASSQQQSSSRTTTTTSTTTTSNSTSSSNLIDPRDDPQAINKFRSPETKSIFSMWKSGIPIRAILAYMDPTTQIDPSLSDVEVWNLLLPIIEPNCRDKLTQYNTIDDVVKLIHKSNNIMVLSGAGISTSAGIPDFRSRDGIYKQIHADYPDLQDPKEMFEIDFFRRKPQPFFKFAKALYPGQFQPTIGHKFIKCIEDHDKLVRNYTQNIDTLEKQAGIQNVIECHGSFARATCTNCGYSVDSIAIEQDVMNQKIPDCPKCLAAKENSDPSSQDQFEEDKLAVLKPNIVFFGEQLPNEFHRCLEIDKQYVDLLIVIGSSLKVKPVAMIPYNVPPEAPQILINKESLDHMTFDIELLGNCDDIIQELCLRLGGDWAKICSSNVTPLREVKTLKSNLPSESQEALRRIHESETSDGEDESSSEELPIELKEADDSDPKVEKNNEQLKVSEQGEPGKTLKHNESDDLTIIITPDLMSEVQEGEEEEEEDEEEEDNDDGEEEDHDDHHRAGRMIPIDDPLVEIEPGTYYHAEAGRYLFHGVELTSRQFAKYVERMDQ